MMDLLLFLPLQQPDMPRNTQEREVDLYDELEDDEEISEGVLGQSFQNGWFHRPNYRS